MSRGPGRFQQALLDAIGAGPALRNRVMWEMAEAEGKVIKTGVIAPRIRQGRIDSNFERQYGRAVRSLEKRALIRRIQRPARDTDEVLQAHPYQCTALEVRDLRQLLLPHLLPAAKPLYSVADNEKYLLQRTGAPRIANAPPPLSAEWRELEPDLRSALGDSPDSEPLFLLLVRGAELFKSGFFSPRVSCSEAFSELVTEVLSENGLLNESVRLRLRGLCDSAFPPQQLERQRSKSGILGLGSFGGSGASYLDDSTKDLLFAAEPELIASLPGHKKEVEGNLFQQKKRVYSGLLDRLIDRHAFRQLEFLST